MFLRLLASLCEYKVKKFKLNSDTFLNFIHKKSISFTFLHTYHDSEAAEFSLNYTPNVCVYVCSITDAHLSLILIFHISYFIIYNQRIFQILYFVYQSEHWTKKYSVRSPCVNSLKHIYMVLYKVICCPIMQHRA